MTMTTTANDQLSTLAFSARQKFLQLPYVASRGPKAHGFLRPAQKDFTNRQWLDGSGVSLLPGCTGFCY